MSTPTEGDDIIDSRDVIERIEELQGERDAIAEELQECDSEYDNSIRRQLDEWDTENAAALAALLALAAEGEDYGDWEHGETLVNVDYFTEYTEQLVDDVYEAPKGHDENAWPWRHRTMDWEAAASELKQDYTEVTFGSTTYLMRA